MDSARARGRATCAAYNFDRIKMDASRRLEILKDGVSFRKWKLLVTSLRKVVKGRLAGRIKSPAI